MFGPTIRLLITFQGIIEYEGESYSFLSTPPPNLGTLEVFLNISIYILLMGKLEAGEQKGESDRTKNKHVWKEDSVYVCFFNPNIASGFEKNLLADLELI